MAEQSLYARLGGYDAIAAVCDDLLPRLMSDSQLGRFWMNRAADSIRREKQLLVDYLCASAGGPLYYTGRDIQRQPRCEPARPDVLRDRCEPRRRPRIRDPQPRRC